jgi:hypothetical protein
MFSQLSHILSEIKIVGAEDINRKSIRKVIKVHVRHFVLDPYASVMDE